MDTGGAGPGPGNAFPAGTHPAVAPPDPAVEAYTWRPELRLRRRRPRYPQLGMFGTSDEVPPAKRRAVHISYRDICDWGARQACDWGAPQEQLQVAWPRQQDCHWISKDWDQYGPELQSASELQAASREALWNRIQFPDWEPDSDDDKLTVKELADYVDAPLGADDDPGALSAVA